MSGTPQRHPILRAVLNLLSEVWSFVLFTLFSPSVQPDEKRRDTSVTSIEQKAAHVDTPLERSRPERHLETRTTRGQ